MLKETKSTDGDLPRWSDRVRAARNTMKLTQNEMHLITKIPKRTIEDWEAGKRTPPVWVQELVIEKMLTLYHGKG